jgi:hypothetical protein
MHHGVTALPGAKNQHGNVRVNERRNSRSRNTAAAKVHDGIARRKVNQVGDIRRHLPTSRAFGNAAHRGKPPTFGFAAASSNRATPRRALGKSQRSTPKPGLLAANVARRALHELNGTVVASLMP